MRPILKKWLKKELSEAERPGVIQFDAWQQKSRFRYQKRLFLKCSKYAIHAPIFRQHVDRKQTFSVF